MERGPNPAASRPPMQRLPFGRDGEMPPRGPEFRPSAPGSDTGYFSDQSHAPHQIDKMQQPPFHEAFSSQRPPLLQVNQRFYHIV